MADTEDLRSLLPVPLHLPEAISTVHIFLKTPEGMQQLRNWTYKPSKHSVFTKVSFMWAMGITGETVATLIQPPENVIRDPPSPIETEAVLLLATMAKLMPTGHQFFLDVINAGGATILLDYITRFNIQIPDRILNEVAATLVCLTSKTEVQNTAVADGIRGNPTTLKNLVSLQANALIQTDRGVSTAPGFLENLLLLTLNAVSNRGQQTTSSAFTPEAVREMLSTLDYVFFADSVETRAPGCIRLTGRIYTALFTTTLDHNERYRIIEDILNSTEGLLITWIDLLAHTQNFEIKNTILDILIAILQLGSPEQNKRISDSGVLSFLKQLLALDNDEIGSKVIDFVGLLTESEENCRTLNQIFDDPHSVPFIMDQVVNVYGPLDQPPPPQPQQLDPQPQLPPDVNNEENNSFNVDDQ